MTDQEEPRLDAEAHAKLYGVVPKPIYHGTPEPELVYADKDELAKLRDEAMRLRAKLAQIVTVCDDNANVSHPQLALKFVREVASSR